MFTDAAWFHDYASHATIEVLKGRLQFANRTDKGYTPFGDGIFVFRKQSARVDKQVGDQPRRPSDWHIIAVNVAARVKRSENRA